jgi:hypothetical protein
MHQRLDHFRSDTTIGKEVVDLGIHRHHPVKRAGERIGVELDEDGFHAVDPVSKRGMKDVAEVALDPDTRWISKKGTLQRQLERA